MTATEPGGKDTAAATARAESSVRMMTYLYGSVLTQLLATAAELKVADLLSERPHTAEEVALHTATDSGAMFRVLRALASAGVFTEVTPGTFASNALGDTLRADTPGSLRELARLVGSPETHRTLAGLDHSVRTGETAFDLVHDTDWWSYLAATPRLAEIFHGAMGEVSNQVHAAAIRTHDLSGTRRLIDVGGGHGQLVAALLRRHPETRGVVFDLPEVVAGAAGTAEVAGVAERVETVAGDFFTEVPTGGDVYVLSWILHDWSDAEATAILSNVRRAMASGGRVVVIDTVIPNGDGATLGKLLDIVMLAQHGGRERTEAEFLQLLETAGLVHLETKEISPWPTGLIVAATAQEK